ncbi:hypothetical protein VE04_08288, partial [Pseudogymnoascus sp. 24MN13]
MDLSNGSGTSGSGFGLGGGSLLSGFGSSSDEEDEEMDEDMNDDDGMRGANVGGAEVGVFNSEILSLHKDPDAIEAAANPNPFADTDSDDELTIETVSGSAEVSAWDMEGDEGGKVVTEEGFEDNFGDGVDAVRALQVPADASSKAVGAEEVGNGEPAAEGQETDSASRSSNFSGLWPFNHARRRPRRSSVSDRYGRKEEGNDFFGGSDSDSDEGFDGIGEREASGDFDGKGKRPSGMTEPTSSTSLDDEEVVE